MFKEKYRTMEYALLAFVILGLIRVFLGFWVAVTILYGAPLLFFIIAYVNGLYWDRKTFKEKM